MDRAPEAPPTATRPGAAATRQRIVDAATVLFYAHGIRATSAERVIERVGITKVTFYRHFRTKSDLVVAYLDQQAERDRHTLALATARPDPIEGVRFIADSIGASICRDGFRGCPFVNAAVEFPDPDDPVRAVVDAHRRWTLGVYAGLAAAAGATGPAVVADQLLMLRDGAMLGGYLGEPDLIAGTLTAACLAVVRAAERGDPA